MAKTAKQSRSAKLTRRSSLASLWNARKLKWRVEQLRAIGATECQIAAVAQRDYFALPRWARKGLKRSRTAAQTMIAAAAAEGAK